MRLGWAVIVAAMVAAGCASQPAAPAEEGGSDSKEQAMPGVDLPQEADAQLGALARDGLPAPLVPAWFDCRLLHIAEPASSAAVQAQLPPGYSPVGPVAGTTFVVREVARCGNVLIDNETYAANEGFFFVSVQVEVPQEYRREGGVDYYLLETGFESARLADQAGTLGVVASLGEMGVDISEPARATAFVRTPNTELVARAAGDLGNMTDKSGKLVYHWETVAGHNERQMTYRYNTTDALPTTLTGHESPVPRGAGTSWLRYGNWALSEGRLE